MQRPMQRPVQRPMPANKVPGVPNGTGPYGRGMGPGKGRADGTGMKAAIGRRLGR